MIIYLDFDGTVVEHQYPSIGRCNFGCIEVIYKLQKAGHKILLNTMRCEFNNGSLEKALSWFDNAWMMLKDKKLNQDGDFNLMPIEATTYKHSPQIWDWDFFREKGFVIIDDQSLHVPLKKAIMTVNSYMVDWDEIDKQLSENGLYEPIK